MSKINENDFYQVTELLEMFEMSRKNFYEPIVFTDESYKKFVDTMIYLLRFISEKYILKDKIRNLIFQLELEQEQNSKELHRAIDYLSSNMVESASKKIAINLSIREYLQELLKED